MAKSVQQRTLQTRARLLVVATEVIGEAGYAALRVEDVVARAGVAKGTFFAHFRDKDTLLETLVGARLDTCLDALEALPPPRDVAGLVEALMPLIAVLGSERHVVDLVFRRFGAVTDGDASPIAKAFSRLERIVGAWLYMRVFRKDVAIDIQVEGIIGLILQALALDFARPAQRPLRDRLSDNLRAWLNAAA
ncbi:TetR/AcrR family transcriptional regulator [Oryzibacter oryziterrae]|uniref:TetR/AcrR family transcriptional regulator n=1 Tax=Oryzibacter oryziterrae TaxID=2766474 RepID=UPI001F19E80A|nr:TetR/AcrR family transcriptional regulator [Oryzibacter oryziterrae]